jgi:predicted O-linked N-acetylglucosamine transferase (SPINDLY family)
MLRLAGLEDLVAKDEADYVRLAVGLARDRERRGEAVRRLREGAGRVFDDPAPVAALEAFLASLEGAGT